MYDAITATMPENRQLQRVEDRRVDDERGAADDREFDELVMPLGEGPNRARQARNGGIGERHKRAVYGNPPPYA
jgi:hypothetical protein